MDSNQVYDKYRSRLKAESIIKSLLCGFAVGLGVAAILTFIFWLTDFEYFWIGAIIGVALIGVATPLFYRFAFKPTVRSVAHRVDGLGLEERILTMTEFKDDQSYMAQRQREDAQAALAAMGTKDKSVTRMPIRIPVKIIVAAVAVAVAFIPIQTIGILSYNGVMPKAKTIADTITDKDEVYHAVSYLCEGDGYIEGDADQVVADGESTDEVMAVPEDGWFFVGWVDGEFVDALGVDGVMMGVQMGIIQLDDEPLHVDENVTFDFEMYALFAEMQEGDGSGSGDGDGEGEPGDGDGDSGAGDSGEPSQGGNSGDGQGNNSSSGDPSDGNGNGAGGGDSLQDNTFLDGNTPLKDYYEEYYQEAMRLLAEGKDLPEDLRKIIEDYYGGIKP